MPFCLAAISDAAFSSDTPLYGESRQTPIEFSP